MTEDHEKTRAAADSAIWKWVQPVLSGLIIAGIVGLFRINASIESKVYAVDRGLSDRPTRAEVADMVAMALVNRVGTPWIADKPDVLSRLSDVERRIQAREKFGDEMRNRLNEIEAMIRAHHRETAPKRGTTHGP